MNKPGIKETNPQNKILNNESEECLIPKEEISKIVVENSKNISDVNKESVVQSNEINNKSNLDCLKSDIGTQTKKMEEFKKFFYKSEDYELMEKDLESLQIRDLDKLLKEVNKMKLKYQELTNKVKETTNL